MRWPLLSGAPSKTSATVFDGADRTMGKADAFLPTDGFDVDVDDCAKVGFADATWPPPGKP
jgi:hypothetical protein